MAGEASVPPGAEAGIVIVHGLGEHSRRYKRAVGRFLARGIACFTFDQRGHGTSPGRRTDINHFSTFSEDLARIVAGVRQRHPNLGLCLWGHSMGSIVVIDYLVRFEHRVAGVVTTGCPIAVFGGHLRRFAAATGPLMRWLPGIRVRTPIDSEQLSHSHSVAREYREDALVVHSVTTRLVVEIAGATARCLTRAHEIDVPWLAVHGEQDTIAPVDGSRMLVEALGSGVKQLVVLPGARHEVHNEAPEQADEFFRLAGDWIGRCVP